MYHRKDLADGKNLEFVEVYNARSIFEDLTGWRISGDIDFKFPDGFKLQAGEFVVIAAAPDDLKAVYGIANVLGPYELAAQRHWHNPSPQQRRRDPPRSELRQRSALARRSRWRGSLTRVGPAQLRRKQPTRLGRQRTDRRLARRAGHGVPDPAAQRRHQRVSRAHR